MSIHLNVIGIMCFPPFGIDPTTFFDKAQNLITNLALKNLAWACQMIIDKALNFGSTFVKNRK